VTGRMYQSSLQVRSRTRKHNLTRSHMMYHQQSRDCIFQAYRIKVGNKETVDALEGPRFSGVSARGGRFCICISPNRTVAAPAGVSYLGTVILRYVRRSDEHANGEPKVLHPEASSRNPNGPSPRFLSIAPVSCRVQEWRRQDERRRLLTPFSKIAT